MLNTKKISFPGTKMTFKVNTGTSIIGALLSIVIVVAFFVGVYGLFGLVFQDTLQNLHAIFHQGQIKEVIGFWSATAVAIAIMFLIPKGSWFILVFWLTTQIIYMVV